MSAQLLAPAAARQQGLTMGLPELVALNTLAQWLAENYGVATRVALGGDGSLRLDVRGGHLHSVSRAVVALLPLMGRDARWDLRHRVAPSWWAWVSITDTAFVLVRHHCF